MEEYIIFRIYTDRHRQKENRLFKLFYLRELSFVELFDLFVEKLQKKEILHRFDDLNNNTLDLNLNFDQSFGSVDFLSKIFQFIRCWVKSRGNLNQRLRLNKLCFD